jgi:hypothetical protein
MPSGFPHRDDQPARAAVAAHLLLASVWRPLVDT